jgi:hypothetical protein
MTLELALLSPGEDTKQFGGHPSRSQGSFSATRAVPFDRLTVPSRVEGQTSTGLRVSDIAASAESLRTMPDVRLSWFCCVAEDFVLGGPVSCWRVVS